MEFLLGRYCASIDPEEIEEGLEIVQRQLQSENSIEPVHNAVTLAEIAVEKGATAMLMPVTCRRQLFDLSDDMATKIDIQFYSDAKDVLLKSIVE